MPLASVNREVYKDFLEDNLELFKNKIVIPLESKAFQIKTHWVLYNNARCHHAKIVKEYALESCIHLKFNPPYSPEFNPIELAFNKVKRNYRKCDHENMLNDINQSFDTITSSDCQGFERFAPISF